MSRTPINYEVVQDSEDEDLMLLESPKNIVDSVLSLPPSNNQSDATASSIRTSDFTGKAAEAKSTTDISSFTNNTVGAISSISSASSSSKPAAAISRPRPRPAYKGATAKDSPANGSASEKAATGAAQPTASTSGSSATTAGSNSIIDDVDPLSLLPTSISERIKLRSSRTSNAKAKSSAYTPDVISIPSSDSEDLRPPVRAAKHKPQTIQQEKAPLAKERSKTTHPPIDFSDPMSIPVPSSDFPMNPSSQLPPSDPPSTASGPKSTPLDAVGATDGAVSPMTPSSPVVMRKRKRTTPAVPGEGGVDVDALERTEGITVPPLPSLFFASSSSSSVPGSDTLVEDSPSKNKSVIGKLRASPVKGKGKKKAVDDDDDDDGEDWTEELAPKPKARPKAKPRKKSGDDDDEEWDGDDAPKTSRKPSKKKGGSDDEEDEWTNDKPSKAKPKAAPKKRKVTQKMSVVIDQPKAVKNTKGKAASKGSKPPTSKELVEDSDDEPDNTLMPPPDRVPFRSAHSAEGPSTTNDDDELFLGAPDKRANKETTSSGHDLSGRSLEKSNVAGEEVGRVSASPPPTKNKGKKRAVVISDEEEVGGAAGESSGSPPKKARTGRGPKKSAPAALEQHTEMQEDVDIPSSSAKENMQTPLRNRSSSSAFKPPLPASASKFSNSNRAYSIASGKSTPMSELIRKVNSLPGTPFASPRPTYSPYSKSSKSVLKRIAPLHPNRRTPPPPPPRPPPPKKSKKQLELEEKWELELEESIDGWFCLPEDERAALRRAKRDAEMGFED